MADLTPRGDVAKCIGVDNDAVCPLRENCLRYLRPVHPWHQDWIEADWEGEPGNWGCPEQLRATE